MRDLSLKAFEETFGAANASADGAAEVTKIRDAVRYYYQLDDAPELYAELTVVDGQIVLIRRLQARCDTWELVRYYVYGTEINVETDSARYRLRLSIGTNDESDAKSYNGLVQVECLTADVAAAERADLIKLDDYRTQEADEEQMTYGIQIYEDDSLTVNPVLVEGYYFDGEEEGKTLSLDDVISYCEEGEIGTGDEFIEQFGQPLHDDRHGSGGFNYRISEGDELYLDVLTDTDQSIVRISVVDAYGYSVVYYDATG